MSLYHALLCISVDSCTRTYGILWHKAGQYFLAEVGAPNSNITNNMTTYSVVQRALLT